MLFLDEDVSLKHEETLQLQDLNICFDAYMKTVRM